MNGGYSPLRREVRALNRKFFEEEVQMLEMRMIIAELTEHVEKAVAALKGVGGMEQAAQKALDGLVESGTVRRAR